MHDHDIHDLPIVITLHAAARLAMRFDLDAEGVQRAIKTAQVIRPVRKEGTVGILEKRGRKRRIRFVVTIREGCLVIITAAEVRK